MQFEEEVDASRDVSDLDANPSDSLKCETSSAEMESDTRANDKLPLMCGVCEGFYGIPWTTTQRKELFRRMQRMQMNTYLYAPKDDYKHRTFWRNLYTEEEANELRDLIRYSCQCAVTFVYALSPGLDIVFSDKHDVETLKKKLMQVRDFGCTSFALLFDDIDSDLCTEDLPHFDSVAEAQTTITNDVYQQLGKPEIFLFCPTEYCKSRALPSLQKSTYLKTLGKQLDPGIDILWTGPKVVSRLISVDSISEISAILGRAPVIWDNLHANDYDQARVYLGPYSGRSLKLLERDADTGLRRLRGVLTNPNCEFEANFIAMHTLAQWSRNTVCRFPSMSEKKETVTTMQSAEAMETDTPSTTEYHPKRALVYAIEDWIPEFYRTNDVSCTASRSTPEMMRGLCAVDSMDDEEMTNSDSSRVPSDISTRRRCESLQRLTASDVLILCDLFYLPFEHGPHAIRLLRRLHWLLANVDNVQDAASSCSPVTSAGPPEVRDWYAQAIAFHDLHRDMAAVVDKFVNMPNRRLLYELYGYVSGVRSILSLVNSYVRWQGMGQPDKAPFRGGEQEPWVHTGGIHAELRRMLPIEGEDDTCPMLKHSAPYTNRVFTIRPYSSDDKEDIFLICRRTSDDGEDGSHIFNNHPDLVANSTIGGMLTLYPQYCYVLEDDTNICGYALAVPNVNDYQQRVQQEWLPLMREKYVRPDGDPANWSTSQMLMNLMHSELEPLPAGLTSTYPALVHINTMSRRTVASSGDRLLACLSRALRQVGVQGIHTLIRATHTHVMTSYLKLGFTDVGNAIPAPQGMLLLATEI